MTILVDANNLLFRELNNIGKSNVHPIRSLYTDLSTNNDLTILVWDGYNGNDRRKAIFPDYKANRPEKGEDLYAMFKLFQELMQHTAVMQIKVPTWEADDVIATLAKYFSSQGDTVLIDTNDADYLQLAHLPGISLPCIRQWAWDSDLIRTYKALVGDKSDNIGGVPMFGEGMWSQLRTYHDCLREALETESWDLWQSVPFPSYCKRACLTRGNFEQAVVFYKVVTMMDVPLDDIVANQTMGSRNALMAEQIFSRYML